MVDTAAILEAVKANPLALAGAVAVLVAVQLVLYLATRPPAVFLKPDEFQPLVLTSKKQVNHNTVWLRFSLPKPKLRLGLPIGQHISFSVRSPEGKEVIRSYTPISDDDLLGAVEFVIKVGLAEDACSGQHRAQAARAGVRQ